MYAETAMCVQQRRAMLYGVCTTCWHMLCGAVWCGVVWCCMVDIYTPYGASIPLLGNLTRRCRAPVVARWVPHPLHATKVVRCTARAPVVCRPPCGS